MCQFPACYDPLEQQQQPKQQSKQQSKPQLQCSVAPCRSLQWQLLTESVHGSGIPAAFRLMPQAKLPKSCCTDCRFPNVCGWTNQCATRSSSSPSSWLSQRADCTFTGGERHGRDGLAGKDLLDELNAWTGGFRHCQESDPAGCLARHWCIEVYWWRENGPC